VLKEAIFFSRIHRIVLDYFMCGLPSTWTNAWKITLGHGGHGFHSSFEAPWQRRWRSNLGIHLDCTSKVSRYPSTTLDLYGSEWIPVETFRHCCLSYNSINYIYNIYNIYIFVSWRIVKYPSKLPPIGQRLKSIYLPIQSPTCNSQHVQSNMLRWLL